jgi:uncharacterized protein (DUF1697 family)
MDRIALLRAINVGGRNTIPMAELKALFAKLGLRGARTLLQSGNVVFAGDGRTDAQLEALLETETEKCFTVRPDYFVRTAKEWQQLVARNPFPRVATDDPSHLVVMLLKHVPQVKDVAALQAAIAGPERIKAVGNQAYVTYPAGIGTSKLTVAMIESKLGTRVTGRNWNTVLKLAALVNGS